MSAGAQERTPKASPSPIDFSLWLRTKAYRQSRKIDALRRRAGPPVRTSHLETRQRRPTECCCWQLLFFRSFYGSSEPGMPLNDYSIPSNPLRPLSLSPSYLSRNNRRPGGGAVVNSRWTLCYRKLPRNGELKLDVNCGLRRVNRSAARRRPQGLPQE